MKWRNAFTMILVLAMALAACSNDPTASDEYQDLEQELAAAEQQLTERTGELSEALADLDELAVQGESAMEIPTEVTALIDEWWAANERADGSVIELYRPTGYHLYGDERISLEDLPSHLNAPGYNAEWITEPYLVAAEPEGRYVVTRGIRTSSPSASWATALTFEIVTMPDGEMRIAQTDFTYVHS
jgi:hypothetical protein